MTPITVPAAEAAHLVPGNYVLAVSGKKKRGGYIVQAFSAQGRDEPIQLRSFRVAAK